MENNKNVVFGVGWVFAERALADFVAFIVSIILARMLSPENYGEIALTTVLMTVLQVFVTNGLSDYLIQNQNSNEYDFSVVFWLNLIIAIALYFFIWIIAPFISEYYGINKLIVIIRVMGLKIPIAAVNSVQQAYICKKKEFKKFFGATLVGTFIAAFIGIGLAYGGFGVWALVVQYLANSLIDTIMLNIQIDCKMHFYFSIKKSRDILNYGWRIILVSLMGTFYGEFRSFIIAKKYDTDALAYYNYGKKIPRMVVDNVSVAIGKVFFPVFSEMQEDSMKLQNAIKAMLNVSIYFVSPMLVGMAAVAPSLIRTLLTEKWIFCVPYLRIFCLCYIFKPITSIFSQVLKALAKNKLLLRIQIISMVVNILVVIFVVFYFDKVEAIAMGALVGVIIELIFYWLAIKKVLKISVYEQCMILGKNILLSLIMALFMMSIGYLSLDYRITLVLQIVIGVAIYIFLSLFIRPNGFKLTLELIKRWK